MKINKNIKIFFNYFLGPLLFIWLCWSIYSQVSRQEGLTESWTQIKASLTSSKIMYLLAVIVLMAVNWMVEACKWRLAVKSVQQLTFIRALKATLSGVSFSVSTPNSIGDYVGRVLYVDEGKRIKAATLTVVSNISQLLVTVWMGLLSLYFLKAPIVAAGIISVLWFDALFYIVAFCALLLLLFYFRISWMAKWITRIPSGKKFSWSIAALEHFNATVLLRLLSLSVTRFFIFILQYFLLFQLFEVTISFWQAWTGVSVLFLILAIIPTIALFTDLSVRGSLSLTILGLFNANQLGISLTSASIWLINLVIPALIGSVLVLGIKSIFKSKNENA